VAVTEIKNYLKLLPNVRQSPASPYDGEASKLSLDVLRSGGGRALRQLSQTQRSYR